MSERELEVDELLRDFQRACEETLVCGEAERPGATKHRALLRNELRKQLLDASALTARAVRAEGAMPSLELLARADGLLSLVYHRYRVTPIPDDVREDMLRTSYELRAITDAMPRPATP